MSHGRLFAADDPAPVEWVNRSGKSPFLLTGDHAGIAVPRKLATLGLDEKDLHRHIGWDIGVRALGRALAERLDAAFVAQTYSRLVIDCNRDPASDEAILAESDGIRVPGNAGLAPDEARDRIDAIHRPYQQAIAEALAERDAAGRSTVLIAVHSFTPQMAGHARPWAIGVLHGGHDDRFARALLAELGIAGARGGWLVGDNQPYRMDGTDHSIPRHAFDPDRPYAELELRQDLLQQPGGVAEWTAILGDCLGLALERSG